MIPTEADVVGDLAKELDIERPSSTSIAPITSQTTPMVTSAYDVINNRLSASFHKDVLQQNQGKLTTSGFFFGLASFECPIIEFCLIS